MLAETTARFLLPFLGHMALIAVLLIVLTWQRVGAVLAREVTVDDYARADGDAARSRRVQRNLSNQFELPVIAYFLTAVLIAANAVTEADIVAAWVFLAGRVAHTLVQTLSDNVRLRGAVFSINAAAIGYLAWRVFSLAVAALQTGGAS